MDEWTLIIIKLWHGVHVIVTYVHTLYIFMHVFYVQFSDRKSSEYISAIYELSELVVKRQRCLPHHWDWLYKRSPEGQRFHRACEIVHNFTARVVQERRSQFLHQGQAESSTHASTTSNKRRAVDFIEVLLLSNVSEWFQTNIYIYSFGRCFDPNWNWIQSKHRDVKGDDTVCWIGEMVLEDKMTKLWK